MVFGENCVNNPGEIYYENLYSYINSNIEQLEVIKNKYSKLLSELTICEELDNDTFYCKLKEINSMGTIIIAYKYLEENSIEYIFYLCDKDNKQINIPKNMKMYDEYNKMLKKVKKVRGFIIEEDKHYKIEYNGTEVLVI